MKIPPVAAILIVLALAVPGTAGLAFGAGSPTTAPTQQDAERAVRIFDEGEAQISLGYLDEGRRLLLLSISIAPGDESWYARKALIEVLIKLGGSRCDEAKAQARELAGLPWLDPERKTWADLALADILKSCPDPAPAPSSPEAPKEPEEETAATDQAPPLRPAGKRDGQATATLRARRGAGVALLVGGAVPTGLGVFALGFYGSHGGGEDNAGALAAGVPTLVAGIVTQSVGAVLAASSHREVEASADAADPEPERRVAPPTPAFAFDAARGETVFGIAGRF